MLEYPTRVQSGLKCYGGACVFGVRAIYNNNISQARLDGSTRNKSYFRLLRIFVIEPADDKGLCLSFSF